jgi:hypothetical protein
MCASRLRTKTYSSDQYIALKKEKTDKNNYLSKIAIQKVNDITCSKNKLNFKNRA